MTACKDCEYNHGGMIHFNAVVVDGFETENNRKYPVDCWKDQIGDFKSYIYIGDNIVGRVFSLKQGTVYSPSKMVCSYGLEMLGTIEYFDDYNKMLSNQPGKDLYITPIGHGFLGEDKNIYDYQFEKWVVSYSSAFLESTPITPLQKLEEISTIEKLNR